MGTAQHNITKFSKGHGNKTKGNIKPKKKVNAEQNFFDKLRTF